MNTQKKFIQFPIDQFFEKIYSTYQLIDNGDEINILQNNYNLSPGFNVFYYNISRKIFKYYEIFNYKIVCLTKPSNYLSNRILLELEPTTQYLQTLKHCYSELKIKQNIVNDLYEKSKFNLEDFRYIVYPNITFRFYNLNKFEIDMNKQVKLLNNYYGSKTSDLSAYKTFIQMINNYQNKKLYLIPENINYKKENNETYYGTRTRLYIIFFEEDEINSSDNKEMNEFMDEDIETTNQNSIHPLSYALNNNILDLTNELENKLFSPYILTQLNDKTLNKYIHYFNIEKDLINLYKTEVDIKDRNQNNFNEFLKNHTN